MKLMFVQDCSTVIEGAPKLVAGAHRLVTGAVRIDVGAPRIVIGAPRLVVGTPRIVVGLPSLVIGATRLGAGAPMLVTSAPRIVAGAAKCFQVYSKFSPARQGFSKLITNTPMGLLYQPSEIPVTLKASWNVLLGSDTLLKLMHPSLHSTSSQTLLEASSD